VYASYYMKVNTGAAIVNVRVSKSVRDFIWREAKKQNRTPSQVVRRWMEIGMESEMEKRP